MRTDPRYNRVRAMLTAPEVPTTSTGRILLCHGCQREVYFAGGFLRLLLRHLERLVLSAKCRAIRHAKEARRAARA